MLIFSFQSVNQTTNLHARIWPEISQYQQNSMIKTYHSIKDQEPNIIKLIKYLRKLGKCFKSRVQKWNQAQKQKISHIQKQSISHQIETHHIQAHHQFKMSRTQQQTSHQTDHQN